MKQFPSEIRHVGASYRLIIIRHKNQILEFGHHPNVTIVSVN